MIFQVLAAKEVACASPGCPSKMERTALVAEACEMYAQAEAGGAEESRVPNLPSYVEWLCRDRTLNNPSVGLGSVRFGCGITKVFMLPAPKAVSTVLRPKPSLKCSEKEGNK